MTVAGPVGLLRQALDRAVVVGRVVLAQPADGEPGHQAADDRGGEEERLLDFRDRTQDEHGQTSDSHGRQPGCDIGATVQRGAQVAARTRAYEE